MLESNFMAGFDHVFLHVVRWCQCQWCHVYIMAHGNSTFILSRSRSDFLIFTEANVCAVVCKGYICGLLQLYEDWHSKDTEHLAIGIRLALLRCLHKATHSTVGRQAFITQGGIRILYQTAQVKWGKNISSSFFVSRFISVCLISVFCELLWE